MRRRVLYDPASPAAAAAAGLLADEYDVTPWSAEAAPESVALTCNPALPIPGERSRVIGVVGAGAPGQWTFAAGRLRLSGVNRACAVR